MYYFVNGMFAFWGGLLEITLRFHNNLVPSIVHTPQAITFLSRCKLMRHICGDSTLRCHQYSSCRNVYQGKMFCKTNIPNIIKSFYCRQLHSSQEDVNKELTSSAYLFYKTFFSTLLCLQNT